MGDSAQKTTELLSTIPSLSFSIGTYVSTNSDGALLVNFGEGPVACISGGVYAPIPGDSVRVLRTSAGTVVLGPSRPRSATGTIKTLGSPTVVVTTSIGDVLMPWLTSYTPVVGELVAIDWAAGGIVLGKVTAVPGTGAGPAPIPPGPVTDYSVDFRATDSGSYGSSWFTNEVYCSSSNIGAWFYGTTIEGTISDFATILSVEVFVPETYNQFPASLATIGLHSLTSKSGVPVVSSAVTISAGTGWKSLPASFGDALKLGTAWGLGTNHGGYHKFAARSSDADSGLLRIAWRV